MLLSKFYFILFYIIRLDTFLQCFLILQFFNYLYGVEQPRIGRPKYESVGEDEEPGYWNDGRLVGEDGVFVLLLAVDE